MCIIINKTVAVCTASVAVCTASPVESTVKESPDVAIGKQFVIIYFAWLMLPSVAKSHILMKMIKCILICLLHLPYGNSLTAPTLPDSGEHVYTHK